MYTSSQLFFLKVVKLHIPKKAEKTKKLLIFFKYFLKCILLITILYKQFNKLEVVAFFRKKKVKLSMTA